MRVLIVSVATSSHRLGGVERHLDLLTDSLRRLGHEAEWLTTPAPGGREVEAPGVAACRVVPGVPAARHTRAWWRGSRAAFERLHEERPYDAVLSEGLSAFGLMAARRPGMAVFLHGFQPEHILNQWNEVRGAVDLMKYAAVRIPENLWFASKERALARSVEWVLPAAAHIAERVRDWYGVAERRVRVFENWADLALYRRDEGVRRASRRRFGAEAGECVFLFAGILSRQKGARVSLEAFDRHASRMEGTRLVIAGGGEELEELKRRTLRLGRVSRVRFLGGLPPGELAKVYQGADALVVPTLRIEATLFVLIEAAAAGLPVAATRMGGMGEVLGEDALWVPPGDSDALAGAMDRLAGDPELRRRLGGAGRGRVERRFSTAAADLRLKSILEAL